MNEILFPAQYKNALANKIKNITIRFGTELNKYKVGKIYRAQSYTGVDWATRIKIIKIIQTSVDELKEFGISQKSIQSLKRKHKLSSNTKVELIKFKIL